MARAATSPTRLNQRRARLSATVSVAGALACLASGASAGSRVSQRVPPFVGKWAPTWTTCFISQDKPDAPLIMTEQGYSQHETHCRFLTLTTARLGWTARAHCTVQGDEQSHVFLFTVRENRLFFRKPHEPRIDINTYTRCP